MNNIAHNGRNGLRCPYCREPLNDVAPAPPASALTIAALTIAAPQLNIQFNLDPITPTTPPPLSDSDSDSDDEDEEIPVTHWETPVEQPTRVVIAQFFNVNRYVDEEDYVYDINTCECIGRLYDPETVDEGMITPAAPLTNFVIVSSFDAEPIKVVMEEIAGITFYMDKDYRVYDLNTRIYVGMANLWEETIDYSAGLSGGVQVLQDFVIVPEHEHDYSLSDSDEDEDEDEEEDEEEDEDESFPMEAQEVQEVMCC
jgi:hypothetical protein